MQSSEKVLSASYQYLSKSHFKGSLVALSCYIKTSFMLLYMGLLLGNQIKFNKYYVHPYF